MQLFVPSHCEARRLSSASSVQLTLESLALNKIVIIVPLQNAGPEPPDQTIKVAIVDVEREGVSHTAAMFKQMESLGRVCVWRRGMTTTGRFVCGGFGDRAF